MPRFEFPNYDGEPVEQIAAARLEDYCRCSAGYKGAKVRQVSQAAARCPSCCRFVRCASAGFVTGAFDAAAGGNGNT